VPIKTEDMIDPLALHQSEREAIDKRDCLICVFSHEAQGAAPFRRSGVEPTNDAAGKQFLTCGRGVGVAFAPCQESQCFVENVFAGVKVARNRGAFALA
jgi:hypothetical protein